MADLDLAVARRVALAASQGSWEWDGDELVAGGNPDEYIALRETYLHGKTPDDADAAFMAMFDPLTILAMLDELAAKRAFRTEVNTNVAGPATCKVWYQDIVIFDGVDRSALLESREMKPRLSMAQQRERGLICRHPEAGGGGHVEYCNGPMPCHEHGR